MRVPILSVVVPTKNRSEYARWSIRSLQSLLSADCEIVVHDNSDDDSLGREVVLNKLGCTVKYIWTGDKLSINENCDRAIGMASGEFVAMIGDDDAIGPDLERIARWALVRDIDAVVPANIAHYLWPDLNLGTERIGQGTLTIKPFTGRIGQVKVLHGLQKFLRSGCLTIVNSIEMPKLYYGLVRRRCLDDVKNVALTFFPGVSPDVAAAVSLSLVVKRLYYIDYPLFLPGSSYKSGAGSSARKKHYGQLKDQKHLSERYVADWPNIVPRVFTVQTLWGASAVQALKAFRRQDLIVKFNKVRLFAFCYLFNPAIRFQIGEEMRIAIGSDSFDSIADRARFLLYLIVGVRMRLGALFSRVLMKRRVTNEIKGKGPENIFFAVAELQKTLSTHRNTLSLDKYTEA